MIVIVCIVSIITSAFVSFVMMKWHIKNASNLFEKHLVENTNWFQKQLDELLNFVKQHRLS